MIGLITPYPIKRNAKNLYNIKQGGKGMNLNNLRDEAFKTACEHGFHDVELSNEHYLMLVITELSEAVEADRKDRHADIDKFEEYHGNRLVSSNEQIIEEFKEDFEAFIKDTVEDELADATIRLLDLAGLREIDVEIPDDIWSEIIKNLKPDAKSQYSFTELIFHICESLIDKYRCDNIEDAILTSITLIKIACHVYDIDLEWHIKMKMKYNSMRENKHGKKY